MRGRLQHLSKEERSEIARKGGLAAHGRHKWTQQEAQVASVLASKKRREQKAMAKDTNVRNERSDSQLPGDDVDGQHTT